MYRVVHKKQIYLPDHNNIADIDVALDLHTIEAIYRFEKENQKLTNQYEYHLKRMIKEFNESDIPDKYIDGQHIVVTNGMNGLKGCFIIANDDICLDPDALSGLYRTSPQFLIGHVIGHKIEKYKDDETMDEIYSELSDIFGVSIHDKAILSEIFADAVGNIVANSAYNSVLNESIPSDVNNLTRRRALSAIYRV